MLLRPSTKVGRSLVMLVTGLDKVFMPMGANFGDIDNDGDLDILLLQGRTLDQGVAEPMVRGGPRLFRNDLSSSSRTDSKPHVTDVTDRAGFATGDYAFREEDRSMDFYVVKDGRIDIRKDTPFGPQILGVFSGSIGVENLEMAGLTQRFKAAFGSPNFFSVESVCYRMRIRTRQITFGTPSFLAITVVNNAASKFSPMATTQTSNLSNSWLASASWSVESSRTAAATSSFTSFTRWVVRSMASTSAPLALNSRANAIPNRPNPTIATFGTFVLST